MTQIAGWLNGFEHGRRTLQIEISLSTTSVTANQVMFIWAVQVSSLRSILKWREMYSLRFEGIALDMQHPSDYLYHHVITLMANHFEATPQVARL